MSRSSIVVIILFLLLLAPLAIAMPPPSAAPEAASVHPSEPPIGIPQLDALSLEPEFTSHLATSEDIARMRDAYGVREPGVTYGGLYEGHGTGLAPPTEEEYEDMVGTLSVMDGVSLPSSLPSSVDLSASPYFPAIGNQGGLNSCAAWTMGYYTSGFIHARANGWDEAYLGTNTSQLMSPAFLYNVEAAGTDTGTTTLQIAKIAANTGQSTWATMPYDGLECTSWPSEAAMREAPLYRIDEGFETAISRDPDVIKAWLAQGSVLPVTVGMDSFSHLGPDDPVITSTEFEPVFRNHAVTIVGYDDTMVADGDVGGFKMVNSWGTNWGDTWGSGGYYWMTYDAFREDYHSVFRVRGGAKVEPSLLATFGKSAGASDGWYDVTFGIEGTFIQKPLPWRWSSGHVPDLLVWDVTEYAQYMGAATFQLTVRSWGANPPTITSFALEWYDGGYTRGSATSVVRAEDVPQSADCTINITWPGITVEATTPGNGTWHTDNVTISGTAAANVTRTIISEDFEGVWGADWYIDDINPTGGVDTWGETTRRVHSGERSLWCAGSDGGAALFDDFDNSAGFVSSWYRSSEGPDISLWTKVTSGYRGAAQGDRLAVVTSEGLDVTEWLGARVVDCSNFGNLSLSFYLDYQAGSGDGWGRVMWSNWSTFPSFTLLDQFTTDTLGWQTYDLSVLDGEHHGYLAFVYHGTDDLYMAVDDVTLAGDKMAYDAWMHSDAFRYFRAPDDYDKAQLEFQYWLESQQGMDMLQVTYYTLATRQWVTLWSISGGAGQWRTGRVDLPVNASAIGFVFTSDGGVSAEGAYVDDVRVTATEDLDNVSIKVGDGGWTDVGNVTDWSYTWDTTEVTSSEMVEVTVRATYGMWEAFDTLYIGVDRLLPWFGADTSPDTAETDLSYTFSVSVEDNVGVGVVWVEYWYGDDEPTRMNMTLASDTVWEHWMVVNATLEDLHYVLGCSDLAGNVNTTGVRTVDVVDINGPVIINEGTGRTATTGDPFEFTVTVGDNVGVKGATVWFAFGDGELEPVAMEVVSEWPSGNVLFSLVMDVPANATGNITYRLEVEDLYGNVLTTNIEYVRVVDDDLPVIVEDRTPQEAYTGETFTFNVTVTDNVGIASVEVTYHTPDVNRWTVTMDREGDVYTYSLVYPEDMWGPLEYQFILTDPSGNVVNSTWMTVIVLDALPPEVRDVSWTEPLKGTEVTVTVDAVDNYAVEGGEVRYWFGDSLDIRTVAMDHTLEAVIPTPRHPDGDLHMEFTVEDGWGNQVTTGTYVVTLVNAPPEGPEELSWHVVEGLLFSLDLSEHISDANDEQEDLTVIALHPDITVDGLRLEATFDQWTEPFTLGLVVTDGEDNLTLGVWVTVENVNDEPVVHFLGPELGSRYGLGETILFTANATDEDGDVLTYTWMLDDELLGLGRDLEVDWLPVGRHDVMLEVSDGAAEVWTSLDVRVEAEEEEGPSWAYWTVILLALAVVAVVVSVLFNRRAQSGGRSSQP